MAEREVLMILIIGAPNSGKTYNAAASVEMLGRQKALIIDPGGMEKAWWKYPEIPATPEAIRNLKGIKRIIDVTDPENLFRYIFENFSQGLLVLDDSRVYTTSIGPKALENLLMRKRQLMIDIVAVAHGFTAVPPFYYRYATHFLLHRTQDKIESRKDVLPGYEHFVAIKKRVDSRATTPGNNFHPYKNTVYNELINRSELQQ